MADNQGITPEHLRNLGNLPQPNKPDSIGELDEILRLFFLGKLNGLEIKSLEAMTKAENKAKAALQAYIDEQVRLGKIEELEAVQIRLMSVGMGENKLSQLNSDRIIALKYYPAKAKRVE